MKFIVVNGPPTAGKDTFCEMCIDILSIRGCAATIVSSVALVKEIATTCGWDGSKTPKNRKFLSDLKDLLTEWNDVPTNDVLMRAQKFSRANNDVKDVFIFVMLREPAEIEKFVKLTNATTLVVNRDNTEKQINHADNDVFNYNYDWYIDNNGTLSDLKDVAIALCDEFCPIQ